MANSLVEPRASRLNNRTVLIKSDNGLFLARSGEGDTMPVPVIVQAYREDDPSAHFLVAHHGGDQVIFSTTDGMGLFRINDQGLLVIDNTAKYAQEGEAFIFTIVELDKGKIALRGSLETDPYLVRAQGGYCELIAATPDYLTAQFEIIVLDQSASPPA